MADRQYVEGGYGTERNRWRTSSDITGNIWNKYFGWINLAPETSGVKNDGNGNLTFKDVSAEAEYKAWTDFKKANVGNGKGFGAFLLSEKNSFSGHYTFGNINVPKLAVYGVLFGALFLIVKK